MNLSHLVKKAVKPYMNHDKTVDGHFFSNLKHPDFVSIRDTAKANGFKYEYRMNPDQEIYIMYVFNK